MKYRFQNNHNNLFERIRFSVFLLLCLMIGACNPSFGGEGDQIDALKGQLAFCGKLDDSERFDVFLLNLETGALKNLSGEFVGKVDDAFGHSIGCDDEMRPYGVQGLSWSPDGNLLVTGAGGPYFNEAYIMNVSDTGEVKELVHQWPRPWPYLHVFENPIEFAWSPSGDEIAFIGEETDVGGYANLFIGDVSEWMKSDDKIRVTQLTNENREYPGVVYAPSWSPDGDLIAISLNGPSSGIMILSSKGDISISISDETTKLLSRVQEPFPWPDFPATQPSWFPDGSGLVFVAADSPDRRTALFRVDKDGKNLAPIIDRDVWNPVVSPDGDTIAYIEYVGDRKRGVIGRIITVNLDGKNRTILTTIRHDGIGRLIGDYQIRDLSWSPDGNWLIFTSDYSGKFQLYLLAADASQFKQAVKFPGNAVYPKWRPIINP